MYINKTQSAFIQISKPSSSPDHGTSRKLFSASNFTPVHSAPLGQVSTCQIHLAIGAVESVSTANSQLAPGADRGLPFARGKQLPTANSLVAQRPVELVPKSYRDTDSLLEVHTGSIFWFEILWKYFTRLKSPAQYYTPLACPPLSYYFFLSIPLSQEDGFPRYKPLWLTGTVLFNVLGSGLQLAKGWLQMRERRTTNVYSDFMTIL